MKIQSADDLFLIAACVHVCWAYYLAGIYLYGTCQAGFLVMAIPAAYSFKKIGERFGWFD